MHTHLSHIFPNQDQVRESRFKVYPSTIRTTSLLMHSQQRPKDVIILVKDFTSGCYQVQQNCTSTNYQLGLELVITGFYLH